MFLPLFFKSSGLNCLVVGGGEVAARKIEILCEYGCGVTVIAPEINEDVATLLAEIVWKQREFHAGDCSGHSLIIAGTGDRRVNKAVSDEAQSLRIPVNVIDDPELCTVIFSAIHKDQDLCIAVGTGGQAPFMAAKLRNEIRQQAEGWGDWVRVAGEFRAAVRSEKMDTTNQKQMLKRFMSVNPIPVNIKPPENKSVEAWLDWLETIEKGNIND